MKLKTIHLDWYKDFDIKFIKTNKYNEFYAGVEIGSPEFCFPLWLSQDNAGCTYIFNEYLPWLLTVIEKIHAISLGELPDFFEHFSFDGNLKEPDGMIEHQISEKIRKLYPDNILDSQLHILAKDLRDKRKSIIFQQRLPWEIGFNTEKMCFYVYGRFSTGIV